MRKNGFTLIELLAVIVILAIIALIATPIILGIINDAREKTNERGVELYASAVKNAVAAYQLTGTNAPTSFNDLNVQYDGKVECSVKELYEDGSFYLEGCKVNGSEKEYSYGTKKEKTIVPGKLNSVCTPSKEQLYATNPLEAGYKYDCKVDPDKELYTFYVLNTPAEDATSVNLIMDSNITSAGVPIKEENPSDYGNVAWTSWSYLEEHAPQEDLDNYENTNIYGPITAMSFLQKVTESWTNVNLQTISTFTDDKGNSYSMPEYKTNARMPYNSELSAYDGTNAYLFEYLPADCFSDYTWSERVSCDESTNIDGVHEKGMKHVMGLFGYWTMSSSSTVSTHASRISYGAISSSFVSDTEGSVRPVINLSI